jgi:hypothetical protein
MARHKSEEKDGKKLCTRCKQWKPVTEFSPDRRKPDGTIYYKPVCKSCHNGHLKERLRERSQKEQEQGELPAASSNQDNAIIHTIMEAITETTPKAITDTITDTITALTFEEIQELRELLKVKGQLLNLLNNDHKADHNDTITANKSDRIKKTYNIDPGIVEVLNKYSGETGQSQSDIVNMALSLYLSDHKNAITKP